MTRPNLKNHPNKLVENMRTVDTPEFEQHLKNLDVYGYTVVPQFVDSKTLEKLRSLTNHHYEASSKDDYLGRPDRDADDKLVYNLQNKDKFFLDVLVDPFVRQLLMVKLNDPFYRFLPADVPNYILGYYNARTSGKSLDLHIDSYIPNQGDHTWVMQVVFVLDDMNEENGCTQVVPGSHLSGRYTDRDMANLKPLIAKAGDVVFWDSRLWHGTAANKSGVSRWALIATVTQWWIKQSMDMPRGMSDEIYQQLSDEQKSLLGFCSIPPIDESSRINTKCGYDFLKPSVKDYFE